MIQCLILKIALLENHNIEKQCGFNRLFLLKKQWQVPDFYLGKQGSLDFQKEIKDFLSNK